MGLDLDLGPGGPAHPGLDLGRRHLSPGADQHRDQRGLVPEEGREGGLEPGAQGRRVVAVDLGGDDPAILRAGLEAALAALLGDEPALVTVLIGAGAAVAPPEVEAWVRGAAGPEVEVEAHDGGQARPALAIGVE